MWRSRSAVVVMCIGVGNGCGSPGTGEESGSSEGSSSESSSSSSSSSESSSEASSGGPVEATLLVTEFLANPHLGPDSITDAQWVEIHNATAEDIDLQGLTLAAAQSSQVIDESVVVPAGGYVLLAGSTTDAEAGGATIDFVWSAFAGFATQGGTVAIRDGNAPIDEVMYAPGTFPNTVRGQALSLDAGSMNPVANDDGTNWCAADVAPGGNVQATPRGENQPCP